jgi:hypothetical protein
LYPAEIATAVLNPLTGTGVLEFAVLPLPKAPVSFSPQHRTVPFATTAQLNWCPDDTATAAVSPLTVTGMVESVVIPFPNCP